MALLPTRLGGLGLFSPVLRSSQEHAASLKVTALSKAIIQRADSYSYNIMAAQLSAMAEIASIKNSQHNTNATDLKKQFPEGLHKVFEIAAEKGSSS